jgi:hypothetical protein
MNETLLVQISQSHSNEDVDRVAARRYTDKSFHQRSPGRLSEESSPSRSGSPFGSLRGKSPLKYFNRRSKNASVDLGGSPSRDSRDLQRKPSQHEADGLYNSIRYTNPFANNEAPKEVPYHAIHPADRTGQSVDLSQLGSNQPGGKSESRFYDR